MFDRRQLLRTTAAFAVSGPAPRALAAEKPSIKVGTILPLTGPAADNGVLYNAALKLAVEDVNAAGGVNGSKLEWLQEDDRSLVPVAVGCFRKHERQSAVVVLGPPTAACWEAVEPITKEIKLPTLCFTASRTRNNSAQPYALRIAPPDDTAIPEGMAEFVKLHASVKKIAIAGDAQDAAGMEFIASVARDFGLDIVATAACQPRTSDFGPEALKIREANPDAVFIAAREATSLPLSISRRLVSGRATAALGAEPPEHFATRLLAALATRVATHAQAGFAPIRAAWMAAGPPLGAPVSIQQGVSRHNGRYEGLSPSGGLLLAARRLPWGGPTHGLKPANRPRSSTLHIQGRN
jgi:hypothetical protein